MCSQTLSGALNLSMVALKSGKPPSSEQEKRTREQIFGVVYGMARATEQVDVILEGPVDSAAEDVTAILKDAMIQMPVRKSLMTDFLQDLAHWFPI